MNQPGGPQRPVHPPRVPPAPIGAPRPPAAAPVRPAGPPPGAPGPYRPVAPAGRPQAPRPQAPRPQSPRPGPTATPSRPYSPPPAARQAPPPAPPVRQAVAQAVAQAKAEPEPLGPPPRPRKRRIGGLIALLVIAGGIGGAVWYTTHNAPASAAVGDCVAQTATGSDRLVKISCSDRGAQFRVDGRVEGKTQIDASLDACAAFGKATSAYWEGETGQPGLVLCLEPVTAAAPAKK